MDNNIEVVNEPKKKNKIVLIIVIGLLFVGVGIGCFFLGKNAANNEYKKEEQKEEQKEEKDEDEKKENFQPTTDDALKEEISKKIEKFIFCPMIDGDAALLRKLLNGKIEFTKEDKFVLVMHYTDTLNDKILEDELPEQYRSEIGHIQKMKYEEYENKYRELFADDPIIDEETMQNLDMPNSVAYFDKEARIMYVRTGFGGTCDYVTTIDSYQEENNSYVVYTKGTYGIVDDKITANLKWVFDKDLKLIKFEAIK